jgi:hypothetical protein
MKRLLYKILLACLLVVGLQGCDDETRYNPLPEAVPLTMAVNGKAFAMGEHLRVDIEVNKDAEGNEVNPNEDFDIYFTAKSGNEDASNLFESFSRIVTFPKGETKIQVDFPVKKEGLKGHKNLNFVAFARGYKMANSSAVIKVSDYYRITMSLENNLDNTVLDGGKCVLVAKIDKPRSIPVRVQITPKEGDRDFYSGLPESLIIPAGETMVKSSAITLALNGYPGKSKELVLSFDSSSKDNPMTEPTISIILKGIDDPNLYDMTKVYANPEEMFVSKTDSWFSGKPTVEMKGGYAHSNAELGAAGWKFDSAVEFHHIARCIDAKPETNKPKGFADATDAATNNMIINNLKYSNLNEEGRLVIWAGKEGGKYGTSAYHCAKTGGAIYIQNFTRIYPGMRIEVKARLRGDRTGFVPIIELKSAVQAKAKNQTICILRNTKGTSITQSVTGEKIPDSKAKTTAMPQADEDNIYWVEFVDEEHINLGINGTTTLSVSKNDLASWPFDKASTGSSVGYKGLFLVVKMALLSDLDGVTMPDGWDSNLGLIDPSKYETEGPRMDIDWIRFYTNSNYKRTADETVNSTALY